MNEDEDCLICLESLSNNRLGGGFLTLYDCDHVFHASCLLEWLTKSGGKRCPACYEPLIICDCCGRVAAMVMYQPWWGWERERSLIGKLKRTMPFFVVLVVCFYMFLSRFKTSWSP